MPINNITQTVSTIPAPPHRGVDVKTQFVIKQEDFQDHLQGTTVSELNILKDQLNLRIGEINSTTTTMNGYADTASTGASTATTKAGEASASASEALTYRNQAETFKNNASNSATKASQWADNNYNVEVEAGKYSAKHWATVAQNTVNNKIDKVASTDNAVVRFNGATGSIQNSAITIDDSGNIGSGVQTFNGLGGTGFKNYIINGGFDIWQRGTSFSLSGLTYTADRFIVVHTTGGTATKVEGLNGFGNAIQINGSSSGNAILAQRIEASNSAALGRNNSGYATLSFYAKANKAGQPIHINIIIPTVSDNYAGSNIVKNIQIGVTSTGWTKYIYTFPLDFVYWGGVHLEIAGLNVTTFAVCGVQLEGGSVATPFEQRPYGLELSLCQRYYWMRKGLFETYGYGVGTSSTSASGGIEFPVTMRASPTVYKDGTSLSFAILGAGGGLIGVTSLAFSNQSNNSVFWTATSSLMTGGQATCLVGTLASTYIAASAEL